MPQGTITSRPKTKKGRARKNKRKPTVKKKPRSLQVKRRKTVTKRQGPIVPASATAIPSAIAHTVPLPAQPLPTSSPAPATAGYKALTPPQRRQKLWLAVAGTSAIIVLVWLYFLQRSWSDIPESFSETIANTQVDDLVSNIEQQLDELKQHAQTISTETDTRLVPPTLTTEPTTEELNSLFSDLQ